MIRDFAAGQADLMKNMPGRRFISFVLLLVGAMCFGPASRLAFGDDALAAGPLVTNLPGSLYPQVTSDRVVTFRIKAEQARQVQIEIQLPSPLVLDMTKDQDGYWLAKTSPVPTGFFYYSVIVDGFATTDPGSRIFSGRGGLSSAIEITSSNVEYYDISAIPHGTIREMHYYSQSVGSWRNITVYTPPDYDVQSAVRYPVLYLQADSGEDETAWARQGREGYILDKLIDEGLIRPIIVVNENGTVRVGNDTSTDDTGVVFDQVIAKELVPFIDKSLRTLPDRADRAFAGFGKGADQAMSIALAHPDEFSGIGAFNPAFSEFNPGEDAGRRIFDAAALNRSLRLFYVGVTTDDPLYLSVEDAHQSLDKAGVVTMFVKSKGPVGWVLARRQLADFVPRLFAARPRGAAAR